MTVTKDMTIGDILRIDINTANVFMQMGMHCIGCPASLGETLEEAAAVHGIDPDEVEKVINDYLASKGPQSADGVEEKAEKQENA